MGHFQLKETGADRPPALAHKPFIAKTARNDVTALITVRRGHHSFLISWDHILLNLCKDRRMTPATDPPVSGASPPEFSASAKITRGRGIIFLQRI